LLNFALTTLPHLCPKNQEGEKVERERCARATTAGAGVFFSFKIKFFL